MVNSGPEFDQKLTECGAYDCNAPGVARVAVDAPAYEYDQYGFEVRFGETMRVLVCASHRDSLLQEYAAYRQRERERQEQRDKADAEIERLTEALNAARHRRNCI